MASLLDPGRNEALMSKLGNFFVLLIYVLGAYVLPFAHQLEHVRQAHHQKADHRQADQADVQSSVVSHQGNCAGHRHHFPRLRSRISPSPLTENAPRLVASNVTLEHHCGLACATCIASKASCGIVAFERGGSGDRETSVFTKPFETSLVVIGVLGNLPGKRGPPSTLLLKSLSA